MSKTKRKIITKTVVKNLTTKEKEFFYSRGVQDAFHTVLVQHKDLIQLKDLCLEYEKTFGHPHPTREWHINRKSTPTTAQGINTPNIQASETTGAGDNNATEQVKSDEEVQIPDLQTPEITPNKTQTP